MATQIFDPSNAPSDSYRWSFVYVDGDLEEMFEEDIFVASTPKPNLDGYFELLFVDKDGIIRPCVAKLTNDNGHISGLVTLVGDSSYHFTG